MTSILATALLAAACFWLSIADRSSGPLRWRKPPELAGARLMFVETEFRTEQPFPMSARVDRAYLMTDDTLVLVELKSRRRAAVYYSDVVQLSAQKVGVEGATGLHVASYAFVSVHGWSSWRTARVDLLGMTQVQALAQRRQRILGHRIPPRFAQSKRLCADCAFASSCDRKT